MIFIISLITVSVIMPLTLAGTARLFGDFCGAKHESVTLLGGCLGTLLLFQTGTLPAVVTTAWNIFQRHTASEMVLYCGKIFSLCAMSFCIPALIVLSIELPSRWLLSRSGYEMAIPWELVRVLVIVLCLSTSISWLTNLILGYL